MTDKPNPAVMSDRRFWPLFGAAVLESPIRAVVELVLTAVPIAVALWRAVRGASSVEVFVWMLAAVVLVIPFTYFHARQVWLVIVKDNSDLAAQISVLTADRPDLDVVFRSSDQELWRRSFTSPNSGSCLLRIHNRSTTASAREVQVRVEIRPDIPLLPIPWPVWLRPFGAARNESKERTIYPGDSAFYHFFNWHADGSFELMVSGEKSGWFFFLSEKPREPGKHSRDVRITVTAAKSPPKIVLFRLSREGIAEPQLEPLGSAGSAVDTAPRHLQAD